MSAQEQQPKDGGFVLPPPNDAPATSVDAAASASPAVPVPVTLDLGQSDTSSRDLLIGGGILTVLLVAFFFARGSYANMLVRKRVPPGKANAAGWWLFIFLSSLSTGVILAAVNPVKFLAPLTIIPLGAVALVALILMLISGRR
ncbi:conserved membrane hypothetical protein [uncultured Stenotrophomonas sp.]|uniref:Transmembrane protein n=1 Tax=uncultured Stenotrophomonas sp. TaxID=165438 RepID=A0A1Y5Q9Q9_9GAMM|nr:conserved membrane hypothetical protein [uncultured Stenotrophomonas sp.]